MRPCLCFPFPVPFLSTCAVPPPFSVCVVYLLLASVLYIVSVALQMWLERSRVQYAVCSMNDIVQLTRTDVVRTHCEWH